MAVSIAEYFRQHLAAPDTLLYRQFLDGAWHDASAGEIAALIGRWQAALGTLGLDQGDRVGVDRGRFPVSDLHAIPA